MLLKRAVGLGSLAVVGMALALAPAQAAGAQRVSRAASTGLVPRTPPPRTPTAQLQLPADGTGSIIVKFKDTVRTRVTAGVIASLGNVNIDPTRAIMDQFGLTAKAALPWTPERLGRLQARAAANSGKAQPDLAGIIEFEGPADNLLAAAKAFNELPSVEWVDFRRKWAVYPGPPADEQCCLPGPPEACINIAPLDCVAAGGVPSGPGTDCATGLSCLVRVCCIPDPPDDPICAVITEVTCVQSGGEFQGAETDCGTFDCAAVDNQCGMVLDDCFTVHFTAFCSDEDCCNLVCGLDERCCDEVLNRWDETCVGLANLFCVTPPGGPDRCISQFNTGCFETHPTGGCIDPSCCNIVCTLDPFCCDLFLGFWDASCVATADEFCGGATAPGPTPVFSAAQGYLRPGRYIEQANGAPATVSFPSPSLIGFEGEGWDLRGENYALWVINEIHADPDPVLGDANGDGIVSAIHDDFVEIINNFDIAIDISGWTLSDSTMVRHTFPPGTVVPGARAIVVFGGGVPTGDFGGALVQLATTGTLDLEVAGDTVTLMNTDGDVVASNTYIGGVAGTSLTRLPDVTGSELAGLMATNTAPGVDPTVLFTPGTRLNGDPFTDTYEGLYGLSRELFEVFGIGDTLPPGSADFDDIRFNARGKGVKVAVIEWAYYEGHEDLDVITEPGLTLVVVTETEPDHATACLGIINAQENNRGVVGIAPEAQAMFFPLTSVETGPRQQAAFLSAYETLDAGDVVSCSFGPENNLNNNLFDWTLLRLGSDLGITTCVAAGNDCDNLSQTGMNLGDSGAIVVGAGQGGFPYCRLIFSNYFSTGDEVLDSNVVHVQAWGLSVTTCGYGLGLVNPGDNPDRRYTNQFSGTSAATPQIAGLAACLQGLARQFYGIHLQPEVIRQAVGTGFVQCGIIDADDLPGFPAELDCGPDVDPDSGPNKIGRYPFLVGAPLSSAQQILTQSSAGFSDSPLVDGLTILTGELIQGNVFSIKGADNNYLIVESRHTNPSDVGQDGHGGLAA
ncbi:MAG: lamin tail domain-containing protein, partial [Planctomycetes bacterium]|nr:lamin tail domain-containing protein [Planctomycetota bacterium]